ncbi:hypothetical protein I546_4067 [Mycobacterium kansasii 732]|nr:hypothetical protein I546_4067 [Mycobacterium kansasii 732]
MDNASLGLVANIGAALANLQLAIQAALSASLGVEVGAG